jgi:hypothetical protein
MRCMCLQLGEADLATLTTMGESLYKCKACAKALGSRSKNKTPAQLKESLPNHEGAVLHLTKRPRRSSLSTQLEAVRLNCKCTIQLIESLVDMVSNLRR